MKATLTLREGNYPAIYGHIHNDFVSEQKNREVRGMLTYDEMKLQHNIYTNYMSGETVGFVSSDKIVMVLQNEMLDLFQKQGERGNSMKEKHAEDDLDSEDNEDNIAEYANQWKFRTTFNKTWNLEFIYNDGSLEGEANTTALSCHCMSPYDWRASMCH